jgi:hypothetical protein
MSRRTRGYLGDGVYAAFDGQQIILSANGDGINLPASDTIYLEPEVFEGLKTWVESGYRDHVTGKKFEETS